MVGVNSGCWNCLRHRSDGLGLCGFQGISYHDSFRIIFCVICVYLVKRIGYYNKYKNLGYLTTTPLLSILEVFVYQPMVLFFATG